jgi:hypothetical protein
MGRMIKNAVPRNASHAIGLPIGTSAIGPDSPTVGQTRWNTTTSRFEYYTGSVWGAVAHEGNVTIVKDSFSGNSTLGNTTFTMSKSYTSGSEAQVLVFVGQTYQNPGVAYTFNGSTTITFTSVPATGTNNILLLHNFASTIAA